MTPEQFFPTRWVIRGVTRQGFAIHLERMRKKNPQLARKYRNHGYWIGCIPTKRYNPAA